MTDLIASPVALVNSFCSKLNNLYHAKLPLSKSKVAQITEVAVKDGHNQGLHHEFVRSVERFIRESPADYKLPGLYLIDSIVKLSKNQHREKDRFGPMFGYNLHFTVCQAFQNCLPTDKPKIIILLELWNKVMLFSASILKSLLDEVFTLVESSTRDESVQDDQHFKVVNQLNFGIAKCFPDDLGHSTFFADVSVRELEGNESENSNSFCSQPSICLSPIELICENFTNQQFCFPPPKYGCVTILSNTLSIDSIPVRLDEGSVWRQTNKHGPVTMVNFKPKSGHASVCYQTRKHAFYALSELRNSSWILLNKMKISWTLGEGIRQKTKYAEFFNSTLGCSFIPLTSMREDGFEVLDELEFGGQVDEQSMPYLTELRQCSARLRKLVDLSLSQATTSTTNESNLLTSKYSTFEDTQQFCCSKDVDFRFGDQFLAL